MKQEERFKAIFIIPFSMWLSIVPLGEALELWRPEWVALALIYLMLMWPNQLGIFVAMAVGLLVDLLEGSPVLGQHALGYVALAYFMSSINQRFRSFPGLQQALLVMMLVGVSMLVVKLTTQLFSYSGAGLVYWLPALSSMLVWPIMRVLLLPKGPANRI